MGEPVSTTEKSMKISAISKDAVHHICSGQVVLDLATAIKELVENSLDSGATVIDVKLTDYGKTCITVSDNGSGVSEQDFEGLGLKHHTSKLREFSDLTEVNTFGFRGEALSSLCALSHLSVITKHHMSKHGFKLEFDHNGILSNKEACAREIGTTVHVKDIFNNLPVRAKEFERNLKKEYARAIQVLYSYCLVSTNKKIMCTNSLAGKPAKLIVSSANACSILKNISTVFGPKSVDGLIKVGISSPDESTLEEYNLPKDVSVDFEWDCYVSNSEHTYGRSSPDRQFFYVNGRPCDLTKISKLINQIYQRYNNRQYPFVFLNLKVNQKCADVNVTPDKRTILFTQERLIIAAIKYSLVKTWDKMQGCFTMKTLDELNFTVKRKASLPETNLPAKKLQLSNSFTRTDSRSVKTQDSPGKGKINNTVINRRESDAAVREKLIDMEQFSSSNKVGKSSRENEETLNAPSENVVEDSISKEEFSNVDASNNDNTITNCFKQNENTVNKINVNNCNFFESVARIRRYNTNERMENVKVSNDPHNISAPLEEPLREMNMSINIGTVRKKLLDRQNANKSSESKQRRIKYRAQIGKTQSGDAEKELKRGLSKESFNQMEILGQFNLGFILARLEDDLFIIDQHASDEKFRFEKLSNETKLKTQKLIAPKALNLSALNEAILMEHQQMFEDNGFEFDINNEAECGQRIRVVGMPVSGNWQFGHQDIEELCYLIREGQAETKSQEKILRPSRVRQMLASRACRSAVMIGTSLNNAEMRKLVNQMSQMKNPWNCPHGRPTIRHVVSLLLVNRQ